MTCYNCRHSWHDGKELRCRNEQRMALTSEPWWCYSFSYEPGTDQPEKRDPYAK